MEQKLKLKFIAIGFAAGVATAIAGGGLMKSVGQVGMTDKEKAEADVIACTKAFESSDYNQKRKQKWKEEQAQREIDRKRVADEMMKEAQEADYSGVDPYGKDVWKKYAPKEK